jgi:Fe-S-cluster containining protein
MSGPAEDPVREGLRRLYADVQERIAAHAPVCVVSGRCCRFVEYDHTLFVSRPEMELLLDEGPLPCRPLDDGQTCPWQDAQGRCTAREARPLGCRLYYCDPSFQTAMLDLAESATAALKHLHDEQDRPWDYRPLHAHLRRLREEGQFPEPVTETAPASRLDT